ncbi:phage major capsid protein [Methylocystis sp. S23]
MVANTNAALAPIELKSGDENDAADIVTKALEDFTATVNERFEAIEKKFENDNGDKLAARLEKIEAKLNRPGAPAIIAHRDDNGKTEKKAFVDYARSGEIDRKALSVASNGGVLIPEILLTELLKNLVEISPVRSLARVTNVGVPVVQLPKRSAGPTAAWVSETGTRTETSSTYPTPQSIEAYELGVYTDVSLQLLEDSMFDVGSEIVKDLAEAFAKAEGAAFVSGDGDGKPTGFLTSPAAGSVVDSTVALGAMPSADDFISAFYALPSAFARNAVWVMNRSMLGAVRKMKNGTTGEYIWHDNAVASASLPFGGAGTLLGAPVIEVPDMPSLAASTVVAVVGDFKEAYRIIDRVGLDFLRDDYTQRTSGKVRFHARRRVGGEVVNAPALRYLKTTAGA